MDAEAAMMHTLRGSSLHPNIGTAVAVSAAVQTPKDEPGRRGGRVDVAPIERRVLGDRVGDMIGRARWGGWIGPGRFFSFFGCRSSFCVSEVEPGAQKIRSDLKKVNTSWSL